MKPEDLIPDEGKLLFFAVEPETLAAANNVLKDTGLEIFSTADKTEAEAFLQTNDIDIFLFSYEPEKPSNADNLDFLKIIKKKFPTVNRVAYMDPDYWADTIRLLLKGLISSNFEKDQVAAAFLGTLRHTLYARKTLKNKQLLTLFKNAEDLPSIPKIYHEFMDALENDRSMKEITHIIERDVSIATRVLRIANSDFSRGGRIGSIERACIYLGLDTIKNIVFTVSLTSNIRLSREQLNYLEKIIYHSVQVNSNFQKMYKTHTGKALPEQFSTIGITHDIGKVIMLQYLPLRYAKIEKYQKDNPDIGFYRSEIELGFQGVTHAEIGAYFLNLWNFPEASVFTALFHHSTEDFPQPYKEALDIFAIVNEISHKTEPK